MNLREGLEKGVSQPKVIFNGYESTYEDHIMTDFSDSYFYSPFKNLPENITQDQKDSILSAAKIAIENSVIPQLKELKLFLKTNTYQKQEFPLESQKHQLVKNTIKIELISIQQVLFILLKIFIRLV